MLTATEQGGVIVYVCDLYEKHRRGNQAKLPKGFYLSTSCHGRVPVDSIIKRESGLWAEFQTMTGKREMLVLGYYKLEKSND